MIDNCKGIQYIYNINRLNIFLTKKCNNGIKALKELIKDVLPALCSDRFKSRYCFNKLGLPFEALG